MDLNFYNPEFSGLYEAIQKQVPDDINSIVEGKLKTADLELHEARSRVRDLLQNYDWLLDGRGRLALENRELKIENTKLKESPDNILQLISGSKFQPRLLEKVHYGLAQQAINFLPPYEQLIEILDGGPSKEQVLKLLRTLLRDNENYNGFKEFVDYIQQDIPKVGSISTGLAKVVRSLAKLANKIPQDYIEPVLNKARELFRMAVAFGALLPQADEIFDREIKIENP